MLLSTCFLLLFLYTYNCTIPPFYWHSYRTAAGVLTADRRKIKLIESNVKCRYLKRFTCKGTWRQVFICLSPSPLLGFCSEPVQIQSVKLLQNMVSNRTQQPHPLPVTHCVYILYFDTGKGEGEGGGEPQRKLEGQ